MHPPHRQNAARISEELAIHMMTLHKWRKTWRLPGEGVPSSEREQEGWKRCRQIQGGAGERRHQRYRAQRLLPRAGPIP